jgi:hypothetical protein
LILVFSATAASTAAASAISTATASATVSASATAATTTAAAAKSAATAAAPKSTTAATAAGFRACFIHVERARPQLISIHRTDGFFCLFIVGHLYKTKTAWLSGIAVFQNSDIFDLPVSCKSLPKFIFTDVKIQIAYINILHAILLYWSAGAKLRAILSWLT